MGRMIVTKPVTETVTLLEAKNHMRVDGSDDDALIERCVSAASRWAEVYTRRAFITQTWDIFFDSWAGIFNLPLSPLRAVVSVSYRTADDTVLLVSPSVYLIDTVSLPCRIMLRHGQNWPNNPLWQLNPVSIRIDVGYGLASDVPDDIKAAILLLAGYLYENREQALKDTPRTLPFAAENLLMPYVAGWF